MYTFTTCDASTPAGAIQQVRDYLFDNEYMIIGSPSVAPVPIGYEITIKDAIKVVM